MTRTITVSSIFRKRKWMKPSIKPKVIISGSWLEDAGFNIGDKINIQIINNQLIISK